MQSTSFYPGLHLASTFTSRISPPSPSQPQPPPPPTPTMTPEMRRTAIKKMAEGAVPSSLGTILPSPHPDYIHALFIGPMSKVDLFLKPPNRNGSVSTEVDAEKNHSVIYFNEWSIKEVLTQARATSASKSTSTTDDAGTEPAKDEELFCQQQFAIELVQNRVSRALEKLHDKVHGWHSFDVIREQRDQEALELVVNDPITQQPGALEYLTGRWREKLGWRDPAVGYWFDTAAAVVAQQRFRFVAFGPALGSTATTTPEAETSADTQPTSNNENNVKYIWSDISGMWKTQDGLQREKDKIQRDRNAWLVSEIGRIEKERNDDLIMEHVEFILPYLDDDRYQSTNMSAWRGGEGQPGQKSTRWRRIKKQVPERRFGAVEFLPEDGGKTALDALVEDINAEEIVPSIESDTARPDTVIVQPDQTTLTPIEPPKKCADHDRKQAQNAHIEATGKKGGKKGAKKKRATALAKAKQDKANGKRKRSQEADDTIEASVQGVTKPKSMLPTIHEEDEEEPQSKKRKTAAGKVETESWPPPAIAATRKSSRIAKRKVSEDPDDVQPTKTKSPEKRRKLEPKSQTADQNDTRERTLSVEPETSAIRSAISSSDKDEVQSGILPVPQPAQPDPTTGKEDMSAATDDHNETAEIAPNTTKGLLVDTNINGDNPDDISSFIDPNTLPDFVTADTADAADATTTTPSPTGQTQQVTPHRPTSQILTPLTATTTVAAPGIHPNITSTISPSFWAPVEPLTPMTITDLLDRYPFLARLSTLAPPLPATTATTPAPATAKATPSSSSASTGPNAATNDPSQSRQTIWLTFLHVFARRSDKMSASINAWFEQDENAIEREAEYLVALRACVGKLKRVVPTDQKDDEEGDGEEDRYVYVD